MIIFDRTFSERAVLEDREAFNRLHKLCRKLPYDKFIAENVVEGAFFALWERQDIFCPTNHVLAWLLLVMKNRILNHKDMNEFTFAYVEQGNMRKNNICNYEFKTLFAYGT
ncbi:MAG: hypothetical protein LBC19_07340 [Tannerella sp.]|jgi:DNA-directed RNA polymerase specialized sigma24 family protein|nr:hypothetical protein [Tannerella sp.]